MNLLRPLWQLVKATPGALGEMLVKWCDEFVASRTCPTCGDSRHYWMGVCSECGHGL